MNVRKYIIITVMVTILAILSVSGINSYKNKTLGLSYENNIVKLQEAITAMDAVGNDYFHSPLYSDKELSDYSLRPGKFFQEYLKIDKYCGNSNGDCFAKKYKYENGQPFTPEFKGACAKLKTGPSICMIPQIKNEDITGLIDVNGEDAPNVYGKDLRTFEIKAKTRNYDPDSERVEAVKYVSQ